VSPLKKRVKGKMISCRTGSPFAVSLAARSSHLYGLPRPADAGAPAAQSDLRGRPVPVRRTHDTIGPRDQFMRRAVLEEGHRAAAVAAFLGSVSDLPNFIRSATLRACCVIPASTPLVSPLI